MKSNQVVQSEKFYAGLSVADWDRAEAIEAELATIIPGGLPEDTSLKFVQTLMEIRRDAPGATVEGLLFEAMHLGCTALQMLASKEPVDMKQARKGKLSGKGV